MKKSIITTLSFRRNLLSDKIYYKKGKLSPLFFIGCIAAVLSFTAVHAQTDTLIVRGKVENLTLKLYRQAPEITVARVNILESSREIVRTAQLQPDGRFELKMPLIYPQEECYLTYANVVMPFLGTKGATVEVTIFVDSLGKNGLPLRFGGVRATTNNRHAQFYTAFNKWLKANPDNPPTKFDNSYRFWEKTALEQDRRVDFYRAFFTTKDPLLDKWVISSLEDATKAKFYNLLTQRTEPLPTGLLGAADLDTTLFLTFAKADSYQQFMNHAFATTHNLAEGALAVNKLSALILKYVPDLSTEDSLKLESFIQGGKAKSKDISFLSNLFNRQEETLRLISIYEVYCRNFGATYNEKELEYLKTVFYASNMNNFTSQKMTIWYNHIRPTLKNPYYIRSLDEIHHIQSIDSALIHSATSQIDYATTNDPLEVKSGIFLAKNSEFTNGNTIWDRIKKKYQGKTIYLVFWTNDEVGRIALAEAQALRGTIPENKVAFVYVCEHQTTDELWIQSVVKSKSRGLHIKLDETQNDFFVNEWGISNVPHSVLVDANGKYIQRDAPLPADRAGWDKIWPKVVR
jgi:hypothetical protein